MIGVNNRVLKIQECLRTIDTEWQVVLLSSEQDKGQLQEDTMLWGIRERTAAPI